MNERQVIERRIAKDRDSSIFYFDMYANSEILKAKKFLKYKKGENKFRLFNSLSSRSICQF